MDNKVQNLWRNIQNMEDYWSLIQKKYYKNGYYTTNTYEYNNKIYFAIFHNWEVVFIQDCKKSKVLLARDGYERIV